MLRDRPWGDVSHRGTVDFVEGDAHISASLSLTVSQPLDIVLVSRAL